MCFTANSLLVFYLFIRKRGEYLVDQIYFTFTYAKGSYCHTITAPNIMKLIINRPIDLRLFLQLNHIKPWNEPCSNKKIKNYIHKGARKKITYYKKSRKNNILNTSIWHTSKNPKVHTVLWGFYILGHLKITGIRSLSRIPTGINISVQGAYNYFLIQLLKFGILTHFL